MKSSIAAFLAGLFLGMTGWITHLMYWSVIGTLVVYLLLHRH